MSRNIGVVIEVEMDFSEAKKLVKSVIVEIIDEALEIEDDTQLIGEHSLLDSMKLVEVCLALEDMAEGYEFEFDWTSDSAMSKSRSMFRTVSSLSKEFTRQSEDLA